MYSLDNLMVGVTECSNSGEYLDILKALADNIDGYLGDKEASFYESKNKIFFIIKQRVAYRFTKAELELYNEYMDKLRKKIKKFYGIKNEKIKIENLDDYIKSLKIYRLKKSTLSPFIYKSSEALAADLSRMTVDQSNTILEKNYIKMIVTKLDPSKAPKNINIKDYNEELFTIIESIKLDPYYNSDTKDSKKALSNKLIRKLECEEEVNDIDNLLEEGRGK